MKRTRALLLIAATSCVFAAAVLQVRLAGQAPIQPLSDEFQQVVRPILEKNCVSCHNDRLHSGNLSLEAIAAGADPTQNIDVWQKMLDKLTSGQMPPRPRPGLSVADFGGITNWIRKLPGLSEP